MYEFDARISGTVETSDSHRPRREATTEGPLSAALLGRMHRSWQAAAHARTHVEDPPEIRDWVWGA
jgi:hypothetical protein